MSDGIRPETPGPERHGTPSSDRSKSPISDAESTHAFGPYRVMSLSAQGSVTEGPPPELTQQGAAERVSPPPAPRLSPSDQVPVHSRAPLQVLFEALGALSIADYRRARSSSFSVPSETDPSVYLEQKPHDENSSVEFPQGIKEIPDHEFGKVLKRLKEGRQGMEFKLTKRFFDTHPDKRARYAFIKQMEHAHYLWTTIAEIEKRKLKGESNASEYIETIKAYLVRIYELYLDMGYYYGM